MNNYDKQSLISSIEGSINFITSHMDSADTIIAFVFKKHEVRSLEKTSASKLEDLFSEIHAIENDIR